MASSCLPSRCSARASWMACCLPLGAGGVFMRRFMPQPPLLGNPPANATPTVVWLLPYNPRGILKGPGMKDILDRLEQRREQARLGGGQARIDAQRSEEHTSEL